MNNKQQQINTMAKLLCEDYGNECEHCHYNTESHAFCNIYDYCEYFVEHGYGNIKELLENLKAIAHRICDSNGDSYKVITVEQIDNLISDL